MTDLERWKLRGPVRTLNTEIAEWDQSAGSWGSPRHFTEVTFDVEGRLLQLEQPGPAGAVARSTYLYNAHGQLAEIQHGTSIGAVTSVWRHEYDGAGRLAEVLRTTADGARVVVKTNTYDAAGRRSTTEALPPEGPNMAVSASIDGSELGYSAPGAARIVTNYDPLGHATDASFLDAAGRV